MLIQGHPNLQIHYTRNLNPLYHPIYIKHR